MASRLRIEIERDFKGKDSKNFPMDKIPARQFRDLKLWKKAHLFVLEVYALSRNFPHHELYGLISQLRRAAGSIAANIAEGFKKRTKPEKLRFLNIAQASLEECRYYLILARDLEYAVTEERLNQLEEVSKILEVYSRKISEDID